MADQITDATETPAEITTPVENISEAPEGDTQEINANEIAAKLAEYETNFKKLNEKVSAVEKEKREAQAESLRWQATYKGLQNQTTQKLQEAAALQRQLAESQQTRSELLEMKELLNQMAS